MTAASTQQLPAQHTTTQQAPVPSPPHSPQHQCDHHQLCHPYPRVRPSSSKPASSRSASLHHEASSPTRQDDYSCATHGSSAAMTLRTDPNGSLSLAPTTNGETSTSRLRGQGDSSPDRDHLSNGTADNIRPSSVPGGKNGAAATGVQDDFENDRPKRPVKPQLQRSKSDYAPRLVEDSDTEEEFREWGARHGFEDHYQSEHIISQLASVRTQPFPRSHVPSLGPTGRRCSSRANGTRARHVMIVIPPAARMQNRRRPVYTRHAVAM